MDGTRFDAWTRRHFGLVAGSLAASLLGIAAFDDADAKKKKKKKKKKRCKTLFQGCNPKKKRRCCQSLACEAPTGSSGKRCCIDDNESCVLNTDCCTGLCNFERCFCKESGQFCTLHEQCCSNFCDFNAEPVSKCA